MSGGLSSTEVDAARRRFEQDQDDAEYVDSPTRWNASEMAAAGGGGGGACSGRAGSSSGSDLGEPPRR